MPRAPPRRASTSSARSGAVRQCNVTLTPALRSTIDARRAARRLRRPPRRPRRRTAATARIDAPLAVDHELHAVEAGVARARDRERARRGTRPDGRSRSRPARPGRPARRARRSPPAAGPRRRDGRRSATASRRSRRGSTVSAGCSTSASIIASTSSTARRYRYGRQEPRRVKPSDRTRRRSSASATASTRIPS